jgi:hypothetical protein
LTREEIVADILRSASFQAEAQYLQRGGLAVCPHPRLFKILERELARVTFATDARRVEEGTVVGLVTLYDLQARRNVYAHPICAGPGVNALLKAVHSPLAQAKPQPGVEGDKAVAKFIAWKQAAWTRFLNDELELGVEQASAVWLRNFWKALDRMYGGKTLVD